TIRDLPDQATRAYTLRLSRWVLCAYIDIPFTVTGLDEKIVPQGNTEIWTPPAQTPLYSEVSIEGTLVVNQNAPIGLNLRSTGLVQVLGRIDATGARGGDGDHMQGGAGAGFAGNGGTGRADNGCVFSGRCADREHFGSHYFGFYCEGRPDPDKQAPCLVGTT